MDILLLTPPGSLSFNLPLGVAKLYAFLHKHKVDVAQRNLGLEFLYYLLRPENLSRYIKRIHYLQSKKKINSKFKSSELKIIEDFLVNNIDTALKHLINKKYILDLDKYQNSIKTIELALFLFSEAYPPSHFGLVEDNFYYNNYSPFSSKDIIAACKNNRNNIFLEFYKTGILNLINKEKPAIIGISVVFATNLIPALILAKHIKNKHKNIHVTLGGTFITYSSKKLKKKKGIMELVDSLIAFEGENPLLELYRVISAGKDLSAVPNLTYKKKNIFISNAISEPIPLNSLPHPDFNGLKHHLPYPVIPISATRGCYWKKCAFCNTSFLHPKYETMDVNKLIKDVQALSKKHKTKYFIFMDEGISPSYLRIFSEIIIKSGIKAYFLCETKFDDNLDYKTLTLMYKAGFRLIEFGLESASQRVLNLMNKGIKLSTALNILKSCKKIGIGTIVTFFIGFPGETEKEAKMTLDFVKKHKELITYPDFVGEFGLLENSGVYNDPNRFGITKIYNKNKKDDLSNALDYRVSKGLSNTEAKRLAKIIIGSSMFSSSNILDPSRYLIYNSG